MDAETVPFSNQEYWDEEVSDYVNLEGALGEQTQKIWQYFKYCLNTTSRFFFQHPLCNVIAEKIHAHCYTLPATTVLYRARVDHDGKMDAEAALYHLSSHIPEKIDYLKGQGADNDTLSAFESMLLKPMTSPKYPALAQKMQAGFEGFDADGSGAPPPGASSEGRCNSAGVPFLYAAKEEQTAIAEVRPLIRSSVSLANVCITRDLNLIDFYYEIDENGIFRVDDMLFQCMCLEFSKLNKGDKRDYLATQYLTSLIEHLGYDGIRFRSSLVENGTNYVLFNANGYEIKSSKLYRIYDVKYVFEPSYEDYFAD